MIFIRYPFPCDQKLLNLEHLPASASLVTDTVRSYLGSNDFSLLYNGKKLHGMEILPQNSTVHVLFSLPGGKGGFGSMLRAIGAQIEKTTNREACRDLSGRRLRDINEEQRLKKWISKEAEREAEKIKRRQARIERLKTKAPHKFFDYEYEKEISQLPDRINDALSEGLEKAKNPKKRPCEKSEETKLPKKSWLSDDLPLSSSDSDSDETNAAGTSSPSKKQKLASNDSSSSDMSESSEPLPCSSKDGMSELSSSNDTNSNFAEAQREELSNSSNQEIIQKKLVNTNCDESTSSKDATSIEEIKMDTSSEGMPQRNGESEKCSNSCVPGNNPPAQKPEEKQEDSPIDLSEFNNVSDLEALGLDRLKSALMARGLKCGGTLSDRAQRLWKIRGLQPHQYPASLLAKSKK